MQEGQRQGLMTSDRRPRGTGSRASWRDGLTLIELLVVVWAVAVLVAVCLALLPRLGGGRVSPRLVCAMNLKGIGMSFSVYAADNGAPATVGFDESFVGKISYTVPVGSGAGTMRSPSRTQPALGGSGGATELSTTRVLFLLVRGGYQTFNQLICPLSRDVLDSTESENFKAFDFSGYANVSYGIHVPFGPPLTRTGLHTDGRMPIAADKGPYVDANVTTPPLELTPESDPKVWRAYNSPNHEERSQNVLFADGHVSWEQVPIIGIDNDNIYTIALDNVRESSRVGGESPWVRNAHPFAPFDANGVALPSTDSVIFP